MAKHVTLTTNGHIYAVFLSMKMLDQSETVFDWFHRWQIDSTTTTPISF